MGIAQQEQVRDLELRLEVLPVHRPLAVPLHHLVFNDRPSGELGHIIELAVYGRLDEDVSALGGVELHHGAEGLDHAQAEAHEAGVRGPAVAAALPVPDGLEVAVRAGGVPPDALLGPGGEGVDDGLGGLEVHVCDPQGDHVLGAELLFALVVLGGAVAGAVHDLVKIVLHGVQFLSQVILSGLCLRLEANIVPSLMEK